MEQTTGQLGHHCGIGHDHHFISGRIQRDVDELCVGDESLTNDNETAAVDSQVAGIGI